MAKHYYPKTEREALAKKYSSSKQSRKEFCATNNILTEIALPGGKCVRGNRMHSSAGVEA